MEKEAAGNSGCDRKTGDLPGYRAGLWNVLPAFRTSCWINCSTRERASKL
jgi:hypothetical protein